MHVSGRSTTLKSKNQTSILSECIVKGPQDPRPAFAVASAAATLVRLSRKRSLLEWQTQPLLGTVRIVKTKEATIGNLMSKVSGFQE